MITMSMLTEKDMAIFKGKKVVIYSHRDDGISLYKCFKRCGIDVLCFCREEKYSWQKCAKDKIRGLIDITPEKLPKYIERYDNIIMQAIESDPARIQHAHDVANELGLEKSPFVSGEILNGFLPLVELNALKNPLRFLWKKIRLEQGFHVIHDVRWKALRRTKTEELVVICSPTKTADHSFMYTFDALNTCANHQSINDKIQYINTWHSPRALRRVIRQKNEGRIKIIIGLRDPISQNLSQFYQSIASGILIDELLFNTVVFSSYTARVYTVQQCLKQLQTNEDNLQLWWCKYTTPYAKTKKQLGGERINTGFIQNFIPMLQSQVVDILSQPFNKEKGYAIIKDGNIEVFVYQLEKLNSLVPVFSDWIGAPFDKLEKGNAAEDKWIAESYKQAQKEIEISQEYFDKCFNEPYVNHCYSEADIEKFKARWRPHIKKEV